MAKARQLKVFDMKATALIGEWIRDYMETHKLSQEKMAGTIGGAMQTPSMLGREA